ncbi:MAG: cytochrome c family protein [Deltaproteobacteria bacterium]|nr:cytochrome c family protein [Deltaproteobacteria bacterium]MDL1960283.1 cytochrome c family protein [Deltaproteobacteria bacterium]
MRYFLAVFTAILTITIFNPEKVRGGNNTEIQKYVGSEACKPCHQKEYRSFTKYAKKSSSFESIQRVKKGLTGEEIKKCYFCHTTGYGKPGGFVSIEKTPHLKNAGCEVCHGPGEIHVRTQRAQDIKMNLTMKDCEECHISERVKAFRYKPLIHGGAH